MLNESATIIVVSSRDGAIWSFGAGSTYLLFGHGLHQFGGHFATKKIVGWVRGSLDWKPYLCNGGHARGARSATMSYVRMARGAYLYEHTNELALMVYSQAAPHPKRPSLCWSGPSVRGHRITACFVLPHRYGPHERLRHADPPRTKVFECDDATTSLENHSDQWVKRQLIPAPLIVG